MDVSARMDNQPSGAEIYSKTAQQIIATWNEADGATVEGVGYMPPYNHLNHLITVALAKRERVARQTALDQACKAVCGHCRRGNQPTYSPTPQYIRIPNRLMAYWTHTYSNPELRYACDASAIRALMDEPPV